MHNTQLHGVYRACNYDTVRDGKTSAWCDLLGPRGMQIMEYRDGVFSLCNFIVSQVVSTMRSKNAL